MKTVCEVIYRKQKKVKWGPIFDKEEVFVFDKEINQFGRIFTPPPYRATLHFDCRKLEVRNSLLVDLSIKVSS